MVILFTMNRRWAKRKIFNSWMAANLISRKYMAYKEIINAYL